MSLREEMARYEKLTGESAEPIPIIKICAYLDGVDRGIEELEKIKAEIECNMRKNNCDLYGYADSLVIIDKEIAELKGDNQCR